MSHMESTTAPFDENEVPSFFAELELKSKRSGAMRIIREAKQRGKISTAEIAALLPRSVLKDRGLLFRIVEELGKYLDGSQLALTNTKPPESVRLREEAPRREKERPMPRVSREPLGAPQNAVHRTPPLPKTTIARMPEESATNLLEGESVGEISEPTAADLREAPQEIDADLSDAEQLESTSAYVKDPLLLYYREIYRYRILDHSEVCELSRRIREEGDLNARNLLVCHNLRWVRQIARRYVWSQLPFMDLIQEGNIGLITAAEKFDERMGYQFSTYAFWWIRLGITRAIMDLGDLIRIPVHICELRMKVLHAIEELSMRDDHRIPTPQAIAAHIGIPIESVQKVLHAMQLHTPKSLHDPIGMDEANSELQDAIVDTNAVNPETVLAAKQELEQMAGDLQVILGVIKTLPGDKHKNLTIFKNMHGLNDAGEKNTLEEVGQEFGVSRERIRQILVHIFAQLAERGIEIDHAALKEHLWRIQELEKLCGTEFKLGT